MQLPSLQKFSMRLNVCEVAPSETYFVFCIFPLLLFCIKIYCFYRKNYTVSFCVFLIIFFPQLALSHRSYEILEEDICIIPW